MNELKIFKNSEFGEIRTLEIDGEPWFVGKDVAEVLGYKDTADSIKRHVDDEDKLTRCFTDSGQSRDMYIINESGLYSLILSSKLPNAKAFKRWVTSEVLPAIRKTGMYCDVKQASVGEVVRLVSLTRQIMKDQDCPADDIAKMAKQLCTQFGVELPKFFVKPEETTLNDVMGMIDFIFAQKEQNKKPTYEDYVIHMSVRRLEDGEKSNNS